MWDLVHDEIASIMFENFKGFRKILCRWLNFQRFAFQHFIPWPLRLDPFDEDFFHVFSEIGFIKVAFVSFWYFGEVLKFFEHKYFYLFLFFPFNYPWKFRFIIKTINANYVFIICNLFYCFFSLLSIFFGNRKKVYKNCKYKQSNFSHLVWRWFCL